MAAAVEFGPPAPLSTTLAPDAPNRGVGWHAVASDPATGQALAAWTADGEATDNDFVVYAQRVDAAGAEVGGDFALSVADGDTSTLTYEPEVARDSERDRWLVVWHEDVQPGGPLDFEVKGRLIGPAGPMGGVLTIATSAGAYGANYPAVAFDPASDQYLVTYIKGDPGTQEVKARRLDAGGGIGPEFEVSDAQDAFPGKFASYHEVAAVPGGWVVAYMSQFSSAAKSDMFARFVPAVGAPPAASHRLIDTTGSIYNSGEPRIAWDPAAGQAMVAFFAPVGTSSDLEVYTAAVGADAVPKGAAQRATTLVTNTGGGAYDVEAGSTALVFAGRPEGTAAVGVYFQPLTATGATLGYQPRLAKLGAAGPWMVTLAGASGNGAGHTEVLRSLSGAAGQPPGDPPPGDPPADPGPAAPPATQPAPPAAPPAAASLPAFAKVVTLPSTKRCVSRRSFRIRLRIPRGLRVTSADVVVNRKRVKVVKGRRLTAPVDLRNLPKGRFSVKITVRLADGRTISGTRKYRTCAPKRRGSNRSPV
ncbi:MAG: hypothetical protein HZB46_03440 [Solirubrobacterales bacterium]|nr:hypothetical protein [Solirubrobacterales bacterium]